MILCLIEGQLIDIIGAKLSNLALPEHLRSIIGEKYYGSDEYRPAMKAKGIKPCIRPRSGRLIPADFDKNLDRQRHKIEHMFAKLQD